MVFDMVAMLGGYQEAMIQLRALRGPASVETLRNLGAEIALLAESEYEEIRTAWSREDVFEAWSAMYPRSILEAIIGSTLEMIADF